jgi:catabolite regulation protein CreA
VFFTNEDLTTADGSISCKQVSPVQAAYDIVKAGRYLARLAELL